jgi:O-antigen/teichoic acid export membrane protein
LIKKIRAVLTDVEHRHTALNAILALGIRILGAGMAFFFNLLIAKQLGAEQAGYFFLALAIVMFLSAFSRLGFENTVLRFTSTAVTKGGEVKAILNFSLKYAVPVSVGVMSILFFCSTYISENILNKPDLAYTLKLISPAVVGLTIVFIIAMSLQARHKLFASIPCQNIAHFFLCGGFVIIFSLDNPSTVAIYFSLSLGVTSSFFYWLSLKGVNEVGELPARNKLWISARSNWIVVIMGEALQWGGPILASVWLLSENIAYLSVAQRIAMLTSFILMAINLVVAPKFSAFKAADDMVNIRKTALFSVRLLLLSAFPIISLMLIFPSFLMGLFGEDFKQGALLLQILVLGQAVNVITGSVGYLLLMSGNERDMRNVTIFSGITVLVLTCTLTPLYGAVGTAVATAFSLAMQNLMAVYFVKKRLGFNTLKFWQEI